MKIVLHKVIVRNPYSTTKSAIIIMSICSKIKYILKWRSTILRFPLLFKYSLRKVIGGLWEPAFLAFKEKIWSIIGIMYIKKFKSKGTSRNYVASGHH
jgi:hypothetical protein